MLLYPYAANTFKLLQNPLKLHSWEITPALHSASVVSHLLSQVCFILLILPSLSQSYHLSTVQSPQMLKVLSFLFFPAMFHIFYLYFYFIWSLLSLFQSPLSLPPHSFHPCIHVSNPTLAFLPLTFNPIHLLVLSSGSLDVCLFVYLSMHLSIKSCLIYMYL